MKFTVTRFACTLLLVFALGGKLSAQYTLSYLDGTSTAPSGSGQSFTPGDAGSFPTASAFLTQMTFQTGSSIMNGGGGAATYLDIYANSALTDFVGASTNSNTWDAGGFLLTKIWTFDSLELAKDTTYYAVFSTDAIAGSTTIRDIRFNDNNVYSGGVLIYNGNPTSSYDTNFTATFAASAIPEPSTYAAIAGAAALGLVALRRRWRPAGE
jgi:hypothetical protein